MSDVTKDWIGGEPLRKTADPTAPAPSSERLSIDSREHTPPAPTSAGEARTFEEAPAENAPKTVARRSAPRAAKAEVLGSEGQPTSNDETLLRASLETIRLKADELRGQSKAWALVRGEQAKQVIDERPITAVAAAFGAGLLLGALLSR